MELYNKLNLLIGTLKDKEEVILSCEIHKFMKEYNIEQYDISDLITTNGCNKINNICIRWIKDNELYELKNKIIHPPHFEDGSFIYIHDKNCKNKKWGIIIKDRIIYQNGGYDMLSHVLKANECEILAVLKGSSFYHVQNFYKNRTDTQDIEIIYLKK